MSNEQASREHAYGLSIHRIRPEERTSVKTDSNGSPGRLDWPRYSLSDWKKRNRIAESSRYLNSASMSVLCRRMITREWARALGRELPDYQARAWRRGTVLAARRGQG